MPEAPSPASAPAEEEPLARQLSSFAGRTTLMLVLLTGSYYLLPAAGLLDDSTAVARTGAALAALAGFALVLRIQIKARRARPTVWTRAESLLTVLYILILVFSVAYYRMAVSSPDQFAGMANRTDSLYFTVTTVATVGFGDIHAVSSSARLLVTAQMLLNLVYVGTALRVLSTLRGSGSTQRRDAGTSP